MAEIARGNLDAVYCGSAEDFPLEQLREHAPFDGLLFADVLEHLRNPREVLARFSTLLAPGGCVVASLPNVRHHTVLWNLLRHGYWPGRDRGIHDRTHLRWFNQETTRRALREAGLVVHDVIPRVFQAEQAQEFIRTLRPALEALGIDAGAYQDRATPLQHVWRATRTKLRPRRLRPCKSINQTHRPAYPKGCRWDRCCWRRSRR